jgi:hypothetical protein
MARRKNQIQQGMETGLAVGLTLAKTGKKGKKTTDLTEPATVDDVYANGKSKKPATTVTTSAAPAKTKTGGSGAFKSFMNAGVKNQATGLAYGDDTLTPPKSRKRGY